jgi:hypothetical protein
MQYPPNAKCKEKPSIPVVLHVIVTRDEALEKLIEHFRVWFSIVRLLVVFIDHATRPFDGLA